MRLVIAAGVSLILAGCARNEPPAHDQYVNGYKKDLEDQLGITRANETRERCKTLPVPAIGMTSAQVLASCWGSPRTAADSITAKRKVSAWVYPEGNILLEHDAVVKIEIVR